MNKKKTLLPLAGALLLSLSSCYFFFEVNPKTSSSDSKNQLEQKVTYNTPSYTSSFSSDNLNIDTLGLGYGYHYLPKSGTDKILVVPFQTTDYRFTTSELTLLKNAFFGEVSDTGWQSVASYYNTSSYGALTITGTVTDPVTLNATASELEETASKQSSNNTTYTSTILPQVLSALDDSIDFSDYDTDGDGYIDAVWLVYAPPYNGNSDLYWAYTTWATSNTTFDGKKACLYSWASKDFLTAGKYKKTSLLGDTYLADAHTFIHETGHMLGLDDYYSYDAGKDKTSSTYYDSPLGGVDMMDFNIGDHDAFSKYLLGWKTPTLITEEYLEANNNTLTLSSFTETGQSYLLPVYSSDDKVSYNNTPFDEYLLIEYYTPTGLNEKDSESVYTANLGTYTKPGILVTHINATIGKMVAKGNNVVWDGYAYDKLPSYSAAWGKSYLYWYLYSNTKSYCFEDSLDDSNLSFYRGRLISLLPATGHRIDGNKTGYSKNTSLYIQGKTFDSSLYPNFVFDDGSKPKYGFRVATTSSRSCQLTFKDF